MVGEIICVGTELLLGDIVNTNAAYLSAQLSELGINLYNQTVIGDNPARLAKSVTSALKNCDIVILTGGLGPTSDDITKETVAQLLGLRLIENKQILLDIENYFARQSRAVPAGVTKQALVPEGATVLKNDFGTAPGLLVESDGKKIILLPGPPREMQPMFENEVKPILRALSNNFILSKNLYVYGMGESEVANAIGENILGGSNPTVATYAKDGVVQIRVTANGNSENDANFKLNSVVNEIYRILGDAIYSEEHEGLQNVAVKLLSIKGLKVATAESCTAGMLSKSITEVSGSSSVFEMGVSAYANDIKIRVLGVPKETIALRGAVSPETAALMAKGVRNAANSDIGIGITGVAGPEPSENKPVGLVYIALTNGKNVWIRKLNAAYGNDRERVRNAATLAALDLIRRYCISTPYLLLGGMRLGDALEVRTSAFDFAIPSEAKIEEIPQAKTETFKAPIPVMEFSSDETDELMELLLKDDHVASEDEILPPSEETILEDNLDYLADEEPQNDKKPNIFVRILKGFLPWKNDPVKEIIRKTIFLLALIVFIGTGIYLINYFNQGSINEEIVEDARAVYSTTQDGVNNKGMQLKFEALYKQNSDIRGWLCIDGTKVDYPVYQTNDNDFYVTHDMSKNESRYGAIFADCNATIKKNKHSQNIVLYGHNMIDKSMFGGILDYTKLSFYKENPLIDFDTIYNDGTYKVFAVIITNVKKEHDNGYVFNYMQNRFVSENNFLNWAENVKVRSIIDTGVDINGTDEVITLSTCSYEFDDARTVVFARKVRQGESMHVNTEKAKYNKTPLYPQAYYDKNGGKKPKIEIQKYTTDVENTTSDISGTSSESSSNIIDDNTDNNIENVQKPDNLKKVSVSNYVGLELKEAIEKINEQGLYISSVEYNGTDAKDNKVLAQSIKVGTSVSEGTGIVLTVNGTPVKITVPDFIGLSLKKAEKKASEVGLTFSVMVIASKEKKNTVIMQSVEPDTITEERSIVIYVSNGRNEVPDVIGLKTDKAEKLMKKAGFKVKIIEIETTDKKQIGIVCSQSVTPYTYHPITKTINLFVGKKKSGSKEESSTESTSSKVTSSKEESSNVQSSAASSSAVSSTVTSSAVTSSETTSTTSSATSSVTSSETTSEESSSQS